MTKTQIFNAVYGVFEDSVDEVVVEGHVSKLRKKLRLQLGYDVIDAKRYLGYQFTGFRRRARAPGSRDGSGRRRRFRPGERPPAVGEGRGRLSRPAGAEPARQTRRVRCCRDCAAIAE